MVCSSVPCVKLLVFSTNFLLCIFGALICGFSLWANLDKNFGEHLSDFVRQIDQIDQSLIDEISEYQASLWILVAVGALLFIVGFFGCCGACSESRVFLKLFIFIIIVLTIVEISATVFAMTNRDKFVSTIEKVLEKSSATPELRKNIKPIQTVFNCCGATEKTQPLYIQDGLCDRDHPKINCFDQIAHMVRSWGESIVVVAFLLLFIEAMAVFCSCILCRASEYNQLVSYH